MSNDEKIGLDMLLTGVCEDIGGNSDRLSQQVHACLLVLRGALMCAPRGLDALCNVLCAFGEKELVVIQQEKETLQRQIEELEDELRR